MDPEGKRVGRDVQILAAGQQVAARACQFSDIFGRNFFSEAGMLRISFVVMASATLLVPSLAYAAAQTLEVRRAELRRLLADEWEYTLRTQPELATQVGDDRYNDRLSDFSDKAIADDLEHTRQALRPLRGDRRHRISRAGKTQPVR